jgi:hypothetical protein
MEPGKREVAGDGWEENSFRRRQLTDPKKHRCRVAFDFASGPIRPLPGAGAGPFPSAVHGVVPFDFGSGPF